MPYLNERKQFGTRLADFQVSMYRSRSAANVWYDTSLTFVCRVWSISTLRLLQRFMQPKS